MATLNVWLEMGHIDLQRMNGLNTPMASILMELYYMFLYMFFLVYLNNPIIE